VKSVCEGLWNWKQTACIWCFEGELGKDTERDVRKIICAEQWQQWDKMTFVMCWKEASC